MGNKMRPYAIFSGLWEKNSNVLIEFAKNKKRPLLTVAVFLLLNSKLF